MRGFLHNLGTAVGTLLITVLAIGLFVLTVMYCRGMRIAAVQTSSMHPSFSTGDGLLLKSAPQYRIGDVVRYSKQGVTVTHRIVASHSGWLTTQGDGLTQADQPIPARLVQGKVIAIVPGLGRALDHLHRPAVLAAVIYIPALVLIAHEIWRLAQSIRAPYRLFGYR